MDSKHSHRLTPCLSTEKCPPLGPVSIFFSQNNETVRGQTMSKHQLPLYGSSAFKHHSIWRHLGNSQLFYFLLHLPSRCSPSWKLCLKPYLTNSTEWEKPCLCLAVLWCRVSLHSFEDLFLRVSWNMGFHQMPRCRPSRFFF